MASADTDDVRVVLRVDHRLNDPERHCLAVLGSTQELGCWRPERAVRAEYMGRSTWQAVIKFSPNQTVSWKWVVIDTKNAEVVQWESGVDKTLEIHEMPLMGVGEWGKPVEVSDISTSDSSVRLFQGVRDIGESDTNIRRDRTRTTSGERRKQSAERRKRSTERRKQSTERRKRSTERNVRGTGKKVKRVNSTSKLKEDTATKLKSLKSPKGKGPSLKDLEVISDICQLSPTNNTLDNKSTISEAVKVKHSKGIKDFFRKKLSQVKKVQAEGKRSRHPIKPQRNEESNSSKNVPEGYAEEKVTGVVSSLEVLDNNRSEITEYPTNFNDHKVIQYTSLVDRKNSLCDVDEQEIPISVDSEYNEVDTCLEACSRLKREHYKVQTNMEKVDKRPYFDITNPSQNSTVANPTRHRKLEDTRPFDIHPDYTCVPSTKVNEGTLDKTTVENDPKRDTKISGKEVKYSKESEKYGKKIENTHPMNDSSSTAVTSEESHLLTEPFLATVTNEYLYHNNVDSAITDSGSLENATPLIEMNLKDSDLLNSFSVTQIETYKEPYTILASNSLDSLFKQNQPNKYAGINVVANNSCEEITSGAISLPITQNTAYDTNADNIRYIKTEPCFETDNFVATGKERTADDFQMANINMKSSIKNDSRLADKSKMLNAQNCKNNQTNEFEDNLNESHATGIEIHNDDYMIVTIAENTDDENSFYIQNYWLDDDRNTHKKYNTCKNTNECKDIKNSIIESRSIHAEQGEHRNELKNEQRKLNYTDEATQTSVQDINNKQFIIKDGNQTFTDCSNVTNVPAVIHSEDREDSSLVYRPRSQLVKENITINTAMAKLPSIRSNELDYCPSIAHDYISAVQNQGLNVSKDKTGIQSHSIKQKIKYFTSGDPSSQIYAKEMVQNVQGNENKISDVFVFDRPKSEYIKWTNSCKTKTVFDTSECENINEEAMNDFLDEAKIITIQQGNSEVSENASSLIGNDNGKDTLNIYLEQTLGVNLPNHDKDQEPLQNSGVGEMFNTGLAKDNIQHAHLKQNHIPTTNMNSISDTSTEEKVEKKAVYAHFPENYDHIENVYDAENDHSVSIYSQSQNRMNLNDTETHGLNITTDDNMESKRENSADDQKNQARSSTMCNALMPQDLVKEIMVGNAEKSQIQNKQALDKIADGSQNQAMLSPVSNINRLQYQIKSADIANEQNDQKVLPSVNVEDKSTDQSETSPINTSDKRESRAKSSRFCSTEKTAGSLSVSTTKGLSKPSLVSKINGTDQDKLQTCVDQARNLNIKADVTDNESVSAGTERHKFNEASQHKDMDTPKTKTPNAIEEYLNHNNRATPSHTKSVVTMFEKSIKYTEKGVSLPQASPNKCRQEKGYTEGNKIMGPVILKQASGQTEDFQCAETKQNQEDNELAANTYTLWDFVDKYKVPIGVSIAAACATVFICKKTHL